MKQDIRDYWGRHPNASVIGAENLPGTLEYFQRIENHRYAVEPCICEMAEFANWRGRRVLEVGCGIGTDLRQFAKAGALVVGTDLTWEAIRLARTGFERFGLNGSFVVADAEALPFREGVFDLCYSHGVIHHTPGTEAAVQQIHAVLHKDGEARVMVYHRNSYFARLIVGVLLNVILRILLFVFPNERLPHWLSRFLPAGVVEMYKTLARTGFSKDRLLALATDPSWSGVGNANPLSKVYSRAEASRLFADFEDCTTEVRQLYFAGFLPGILRKWLERRVGWFLYVRAKKRL